MDNETIDKINNKQRGYMEAVITGNHIQVTGAMRNQVEASFKKLNFEKNGHLIEMRMSCVTEKGDASVTLTGTDFYAMLKTGIKMVEKQVFHSKSASFKRDRMVDLIDEPAVEDAEL
jgi:hypothetical protein